MTVDLEHLEILDPIDIPFVNSEDGGPAGSLSWSEITNKPSAFPPIQHNHNQEEVTGLPAVIDEVNSLEASISEIEDGPSLAIGVDQLIDPDLLAIMNS